jgi:hypothetical protein
LGLRGKWSKEEAAETARACEAILKSERALGQVPVLACPLVAACMSCGCALRAVLRCCACAACGAMQSGKFAAAQVILTAGYNGEIKVFENLGAPQSLFSSL